MSKAAAIKFVCLALAAAAALAVFGCGADSATETASTPAQSTAAEGGSSQQAPSSPAPDSSAAEPAPEGSAAQTAGAPAPGAGKQGPAIAAPEGPREPEPSAKERAQATVASISLESPSLPPPGPESAAALPATYTCDGENTWPQLQWQGVPADTAELALLVLNLEPVNEALFFDWAAAGLDPGLTELASGQLPKGAVTGRNSFGKTGYSVCPSTKGTETVIFALYALPRPLGAHRGFDPAAVRKEILAMAGNTGLLATTYSRG